MSYVRESTMYFLLWAVGLSAAVLAGWQFYQFVGFRDAEGVLDAQGGTLNLLLAIGATFTACVCGCLGIFRRVNQTEEFHITT